MSDEFKKLILSMNLTNVCEMVMGQIKMMSKLEYWDIESYA